MLNLRRKHIDTNSEQRETPRIEFHEPATIIGIDSEAHVVDFSLGGFYIESESSTGLKVGQRINIALKLPNERNGITVKAEVVYGTAKGFGCKLINPTPNAIATLERCFAIFSGTLPVDISPDPDYHNHAVA